MESVPNGFLNDLSDVSPTNLYFFVLTISVFHFFYHRVDYNIIFYIKQKNVIPNTTTWALRR